MLNGIRVAAICCALWQQAGELPESVLIPEDARRLLEQSAKDLDGLELSIRVERRITVETSALPDELKSLSNKEVLQPELNIVRIDGLRFYQKSVQGKNGDQIGERTYDGRVLYSGRPPGPNSESLLTIDTVARCQAEATESAFPTKHFYWNYFHSAGYHLPEFPNEFGESSSSLVLHLAKLGRVVSWIENSTTAMHDVVLESPDPWSQLKMTPEQISNAVSHLLGDSKKIQEAILQRLVARSESEPFRRYRFSLDPKRGFAVTEKWEETTKGQLLSHTVCQELSKVQDREVWLPKACREMVNAHEKQPFYISPTPFLEIKESLTGVEPKSFSKKEFELWYSVPGGSVFDYTAAKAGLHSPVVYRVPADESELAKASKIAASGRSRTRWIILLNVTMVAAVMMYSIRRRRTAKQ